MRDLTEPEAVDGESPKAPPKVLVWRSTLLAPSETFVRNHADNATARGGGLAGLRRIESSLCRDSDFGVYGTGAIGRIQAKVARVTGRSLRLEAYLRRMRPDVIHAHFGYDAAVIRPFARRLRIPLVLTVHGVDVTAMAEGESRQKRRYRKRLLRVFADARLVLAVSTFIRERAVALGAAEANTRLHYSGIPTAQLSDHPRTIDVLFVGRLVPKKGVDDLIRALKHVQAVLPVAARIVGDGPLFDDLRRLADELSVNVEFVGALPPDDVRDLMDRTKVMAVPSKTAPDGDSEGLPTTVLEAAERGMGIVATRHSGIPDAINDGVEGLLSDEGDYVALAENMLRLLQDDKRRQSLGVRARASVVERFNSARQMERLWEHYADILA